MTYKLPHATTTTHGVMQVGENLSVIDSIVSAAGGGGARRLVNRSFLLEFSTNGILEIAWSSPSDTMQLTATGTQTDPDRPETASANISITLVEATI